MGFIRIICNIGALLINGYFLYFYFFDNINLEGFVFYLVAFLFLIFPWIAIHLFFKFIEFLKPKVQSQIQDVQHSKSVKDKNYLVAFSEVEENNVQNKELWAKAFAQCEGDREKQKSIYVELRTKELSKR
ncbi:hypothetical protein [Candidatus Thioglobus sp. NP1]|mgnify:CR=1 FL=1|uniref:hypothetical protein n=1 Tax=Candidatus Thioglobus sp. NP1 TaxID=2508687 RepID=UPI000DEDAA82|nr:hypothetical protein [Candidatus Thioglobus sp. NP1]AXE62026.1 hypothetical protein CRN91_05020 [Candidatus Thioglobus sp. NP1]